MAHVIQAQHYGELEAKLKEDPVIVGMANEIVRDMGLNVALAAFTHNGTRRGTDEGDDPTWEFMSRALEEYKRRGGTIPTHIGGPARAILALVKEANER